MQGQDHPHVDRGIPHPATGDEGLYSTLVRTAARALETQIIANAMFDWLDELTLGGSVLKPSAIVSRGKGMGLNEAPRSAIGHWTRIENRKIDNF